MNTARLKQILASILGLVAVGCAWLTLARLGDLVEATGRGADPATGFTPAVGPVDSAAVTWGADAADLVRPVDDGVRRSIAESYLSALAILDGQPAMEGVEPSAYLTGPALVAATPSAIRPTERRHRLAVVFHSADGQIIEATDRARLAFDAGSGETLVRTEVATAVLVQVDGSWHLRHRVVDEATLMPAQAAAGPTTRVEAAIDAVSDALFFGDWSGLRTVAVPAVPATLAVAWAASILVTRARAVTDKEE